MKTITLSLILLMFVKLLASNEIVESKFNNLTSLMLPLQLEHDSLQKVKLANEMINTCNEIIFLDSNFRKVYFYKEQIYYNARMIREGLIYMDTLNIKFQDENLVFNLHGNFYEMQGNLKKADSVRRYYLAKFKQLVSIQKNNEFYIQCIIISFIDLKEFKKAKDMITDLYEKKEISLDNFQKWDKAIDMAIEQNKQKEIFK